jgi:hypothetical protein
MKQAKGQQIDVGTMDKNLEKPLVVDPEVRGFVYSLVTAVRVPYLSISIHTVLQPKTDICIPSSAGRPTMKKVDTFPVTTLWGVCVISRNG